MSLKLGLFLVLCLMTLVVRADELPLEKRVYKDEAGKSIPYRLLKPVNYDAGEKYPLVLFLHGAGERGTDNEAQLVHGVKAFVERAEKYPCFLVAPQCPNNAKWVDVDWSGDKHTLPETMSEPLRLSLEALDALSKEFSIDPQRIYVTGLSMGGYGTLDAVSRRPNYFAAAVPTCGGGDEAQAKRVHHVPMWFFHGAKDTAVKPERSRNMVAALKAAGGKPKYTEYPNEGHGSWVPAYKDDEMVAWLFAQKLAATN